MPFPPNIKKQALVKSRRSCCICHRFVGRSIEVHHIIQETHGGSNDLGNAVALCFDCHAEAGHYNAEHPRGTKYSPDEVRQHRDEWWAWCEKNPHAPLPDDPIVFSPTSIRLPSGDFHAPGKVWNVTAVLTIYNRTDSIYYAVWLKFGLGAAELRAEELEFTDFSAPDLLNAIIGAFKISVDAIIVFGLDGNGIESLYLGVERLGPKASRVFRFNVNRTTESAVDRDIPVSLVEFNESPVGSFVQREGEAIVEFRVPEPESFRPRGTRFHIQQT